MRWQTKSVNWQTKLVSWQTKSVNGPVKPTGCFWASMHLSCYCPESMSRSKTRRLEDRLNRRYRRNKASCIGVDRLYLLIDRLNRSMLEDRLNRRSIGVTRRFNRRLKMSAAGGIRSSTATPEPTVTGLTDGLAPVEPPVFAEMPQWPQTASSSWWPIFGVARVQGKF